jgi:hypothetical protein
MEFIEYLKGLNLSTIIKLWNELCCACDYGDESKYIFDGIWDMQSEAFALYGFNEKDFLMAILNGNIISLDAMLYVEDDLVKEVKGLVESPIDLDLLANWLIDTNHSVYTNWSDKK